MTVGDFFDFGRDEYAQRISDYDTERLRQQEVVKTRQHSAAVCSMVTGAAHSLHSAGGTLVVSAYGGRRYYVASQKLKLIQAELTKRSITLHEKQKRDYLIPIGATAISLGVGLGIDDLVAGITNTASMATGLPCGSSVAHALTTNPGATISGAAHGIMEQGQEIEHAFLDVNNRIPACQDLAGQSVWVPASSVQEAVGFHCGMAAMQAAEDSAAGVASSQLASCVMGTMDGKTKRV